MLVPLILALAITTCQGTAISIGCRIVGRGSRLLIDY